MKQNMINACKVARSQSFVTYGNRFTVPVIYWHLADTTTDMAGAAVIEAFRAAFAAWQPHMNPTLESTSEVGKANIVINFAVDGDDDLPEPFGSPEVLAYAYFPVDNFSSMWFDDSENWGAMHTSSKLNLQKVAVHELGHSLGLGHTNARNDIMQAIYTPNDRISITQDSIDGLASLYGEVVEDPVPVPTPTPTPTPTPRPKKPNGGCMVPIAVGGLTTIVGLLAYYNLW